MHRQNCNSMAVFAVTVCSVFTNGIEYVTNATLIYTDELVAKVKKVFNVDLPKKVKFENIDETAEFIIKNIIEPFAPNK